MIVVWSHLPARNLIDLQRITAIRTMGEEARRLLADGYAVDADRVLDEIAECKRRWSEEAAA